MSIRHRARVRCYALPPLRHAALPALVALLLALTAATEARSWGFYGHVAIGDATAQRLGLDGEERDWFTLGSLMGDLDKSDHLPGAIPGRGAAGELLRWLARAGASYRVPPVVDLHDRRVAAALIERAAAGGDRRLLLWAYGVMCHGVSDRFTDTYPDRRYRVSTALAEVSTDMVVFRQRAKGRYARLLERLERDDAIVFGPGASRPSASARTALRRALEQGAQLGPELRAVDPFAPLVLGVHRRVLGRPGPGVSASDVARQQLGFDAFVWNYRHKAWLMPGWRRFARERGDAWYARVETIALEELTGRLAQLVRAWDDYLAARTRGTALASRPSIP